MKTPKIFLSALLVLFCIWGIWKFWGVANPFIAAIIVAFILTPFVDLMVNKLKFPRLIAVIVALVLVSAILIGIIAGIAYFAISQLNSLMGDIVSYASNYDQFIDMILDYLSRLHAPEYVLTFAENLLEQSDTYITSGLQRVISSLVSISLGAVDIVVIIILSVYFTLDGRTIIASIERLLPGRAAKSFDKVLDEVDTLTWKYVRTRVILSLGMGIVTYIGLLVMGIKYALLFALISFVLDFIPYFGSMLAGVLEVFYVLLTGSLGLAIAVAIFVLIVQQLEGNIAAPKVQGDATGIHPITIMFALLACNVLWGPFGMLISTPIAIIVKAILSEVHSYLVSDDDAPAGKSGPGINTPQTV
ncbi:MAG: AI-2E family transporter [Clostridia bacterium]|nr:AI-2E family transporter [Clostridia bacterium]